MDSENPVNIKSPFKELIINAYDIRNNIYSPSKYIKLLQTSDSNISTSDYNFYLKHLKTVLFIKVWD